MKLISLHELILKIKKLLHRTIRDKRNCPNKRIALNSLKKLKQF